MKEYREVSLLLEIAKRSLMEAADKKHQLSISEIVKLSNENQDEINYWLNAFFGVFEEDFQ